MQKKTDSIHKQAEHRLAIPFNTVSLCIFRREAPLWPFVSFTHSANHSVTHQRFFVYQYNCKKLCFWDLKQNVKEMTDLSAWMADRNALNVKTFSIETFFMAQWKFYKCVFNYIRETKRSFVPEKICDKMYWAGKGWLIVNTEPYLRIHYAWLVRGYDRGNLDIFLGGGGLLILIFGVKILIRK